MLRQLLITTCLVLACATAHADLRLRSAHVLVVDEETGEVLLRKDGDTPAPIASLTKLMTAMVVLDAGQDAAEPIRISSADLDRLKHTRNGLPVGAVLPRGDLLELSLIASDNRATSALARHYPGGSDAFAEAVRAKIAALGLEHTHIEEPTGLSPNNRSSAQDLVKVLRAAGGYAEIARITSKDRHVVRLNGRRTWKVRNTNRFVGAPGWNISLSKTGFTNEAGRCLTMRHRRGRPHGDGGADGRDGQVAARRRRAEHPALARRERRAPAGCAARAGARRRRPRRSRWSRTTRKSDRSSLPPLPQAGEGEESECGMPIQPREFLRALYDAAVARAQPAEVIGAVPAAAAAGPHARDRRRQGRRRDGRRGRCAVAEGRPAVRPGRHALRPRAAGLPRARPAASRSSRPRTRCPTTPAAAPRSASPSSRAA